MPVESLVSFCVVLNQIEADTKALVARMDALNEQAARFSVPVGWKNQPEAFLSKIQPEEIYFDSTKEENMS